MNYKTILCKNFSAMGMCRYGASCHFAHGVADLKRPVIGLRGLRFGAKYAK